MPLLENLSGEHGVGQSVMSWILLRQRTAGISNAGSILNDAAVGINAMPC